MKNIKLIIEYNGKEYNGWQTQKNGIAIQYVIERSIFKLTGENVILNGSGRTDAGVHALGQAANFYTNSDIPGDKFKFPLNHILPRDIVIKDSREVEESFHARKDAKKKCYLYNIWNDDMPSALMDDRAMYFRGNLDIERMDQAAKLFLGEHDFSAFRSIGSNVKTSVRTIFESEVRLCCEDRGGKLIQFKVIGNGFLYNMVRIMAGTLIEIGYGKKSEKDIYHAFHTGKRECAGRTAVPRGLYLVNVEY